MPTDAPTSAAIALTALAGIPEVQPGDNLATLIFTALQRAGLRLEAGDIVAVAHKVVSKAEGRLANLAEVAPGEEALELAAAAGKDPRLVELILRESTGVSRLRPGLLIAHHRLGFTSANAGIDRSNVPQGTSGEWVALLPLDPDASAAKLRADLEVYAGVRLGVIITDSHGRPFRLGTVGVALGVAGLPALWDRRGEADRYGYQLQHTEVGSADEIASAAS
jgi:coenzyme F420-0:L-glutamate ligase/coenzyme F420-1:gamma-L-glutamate ligase